MFVNFPPPPFYFPKQGGFYFSVSAFGEGVGVGGMPQKGGMGGKGDKIADTGCSSGESLGTIGVLRRKPLWKLQCV